MKAIVWLFEIKILVKVLKTLIDIWLTLGSLCAWTCFWFRKTGTGLSSTNWGGEVVEKKVC